MPTGTPFNSLVKPYRIRVDDFAASADLEEPPLLHLLTHTHTDHINGLSAKSFGFKVYCSKDAKEMLLRHEVFHERDMHEKELRAEKVRTFSHLKVGPFLDFDGKTHYMGSRDLLQVLPLNEPTQIDLTGTETVTITAFDANHCPGAVMYLIEGERGAVLHTGDFRAEPWFLESLSRNSYLQPYMAPQSASEPFLSKTLDAIYLDTACVMSPLNLPTKKAATDGLIELMRLYPDNVFFYINAWTWGYEDVLKAIARFFQTKIHVDRYKNSIFSHISDRMLHMLATDDPQSTRFHACERFDRCPYVAVENNSLDYSNATSMKGKRVIYVNPVTMDDARWQDYMEETKERLVDGDEVNNLLVPLSRHSSFPELQTFVKMFRPMKVVPNTLDPRLHGLDWACIDRMFSSCLHPKAEHSYRDILQTYDQLSVLDRKRFALEVQTDSDVALKNLVGEGVEASAQRWGLDGKLSKKLVTIRDYLGDEENTIIDELLGIKRSNVGQCGEATSNEPHTRTLNKGKERTQTIFGRYYDYGKVQSERYYGRESEDESEDDDDQRGRTAHMLFASQAGVELYGKENVWQTSSQQSQSEVMDVEEQSVQVLKDLSPIKGKGLEPISNGDWRMNRLTPVSSPFRPRRLVPNNAPLTPSSSSRSNEIASVKQHRPFAPPLQAPLKPLIQKSPSCNLASPICLSSPPIVPTSDTDSVSPLVLTRKKHAERPLTFSKPRALVFPSHSANLSSNLSNAQGVAESERHAPTAPDPSSRKRPRVEDSEPGHLSKKVLTHISTPLNPVCSTPVAGPSNIKSSFKGTRRTETVQTPANSGAYTPSESDKLIRERIKITQNLSVMYPDRVHWSYHKKVSRQKARLERKQEGQNVSLITEPLQPVAPIPITSTTDEIAASSTTHGTFRHDNVVIFDPVYDDNGTGVDLNRIRQIKESARQAIAAGRKPVFPRLISLESQPGCGSQSVDDCGFSYPF